MNIEKGKWIQFEDGLCQGDNFDGRTAQINTASYKKFYEEYVNRKSAKERRAILIFLDANPCTRKRNRNIKEDAQSIDKLLIDSVMEACTLSEDGQDEFLTTAVVKCEDSVIQNAAYIDGKKIKEIKNNTQKKPKKGVLKKGGRIIDNKKISFGEKYILTGNYILKTIEKHAKNIRSIMFGSIIQNWVYVITALYNVTIFLQKKIIGKYKYVLIIIGLICCFIYNEKMKSAREKVSSEIEYYRSLDFPIIFYNRTGKAKSWMKNYILKYMEGEKEEEISKSVFYIGMSDFEIEEEKIHQFIIPEGHSEWGLICLCKLVRDLADNPWGEIWPGTAIIDKIEETKFDSSLKTDREQNNLTSRFQVFKMPDDEQVLRSEIAKRRNWHFARDPDSKCPRSRLFPIGNSVYVIRRNISCEDFLKDEVSKLQEKILPNIDIFLNPINYMFWLIQVDESECKIREGLNTISKIPKMWLSVWQNILHLLGQCLQNEKIWKSCERELGDKMVAMIGISFADYKNLLENKALKKVDQEKDDQEQLVKQKTRWE